MLEYIEKSAVDIHLFKVASHVGVGGNEIAVGVASTVATVLFLGGSLQLPGFLGARSRLPQDAVPHG